MGEIREKFCLSLFFVSIVFIQLKSYGVVVEGEDILSLGASITGNQTLISKNGTFELGFFSPNGTNNWYIGIWYANIPEKTVVWVANRETPARNRCGVLKLSEEGDLGLFDATGASLWSVNVTKKPSQALILDSGMRFGGQKKLVSWKSSLDPAPGLFSYQVDPSSGVKQLVLKWNNSVEYWASGPWDGNVFSQIPEMSNKALYNISVEIINSGFHVTYTSIAIKNVLSRSLSRMQLYALLDDAKWTLLWSQPRDQCAVYGLCGAYGICNSNNLQFCSCVEGFTPKDTRAWYSRDSWSSGCVRQSPLNCVAENGSSDGFLEPSVTFPDADSASSYPVTTKEDCQKVLLLNCSCTAFTFNLSSGLCQIWYGHLLNMRTSLPPKSNSNVFIRVAASALPKTKKSSSKKTQLQLLLVLSPLHWVSF
ncbi:G-type lectin S-receptor-like serine/threonine-protein kinase At2g19130 [Cryptomeria japonica]|uniref:G-type lectin S-receptor-like serine/threonine-protein kinase At2g19130 n=1 Tax=Cryptomeria japonica TaxID=3369 RepID=UPI0027DA5D1E|nr:G-type lectin S-receptor-like serine/threonine-protein kinase At2g19130 [Cryptomeria japonica]